MSGGAQDKIAENLSKLTKCPLNRSNVMIVSSRFASNVELLIMGNAIMMNYSKIGSKLPM
jgi:hypothetical protein